MKYLLDTHIWIWICESSKKMPHTITKILKDTSNSPLALASISPWEVAKKASLGKLQFSIPTREWLQRGTMTNGIEIVPLSPEISYEANFLPSPFHRDPADQIIVATARVLEMILITRDQRMLEYKHVRTLWE